MDKIAQLINNGMILLGRKIDSLAMELRNKKTPETNISVDIGDNVSQGVKEAITESLSKLEMPKFEGFPPFPEFPPYPEQKAPIVTVNVPEIKLPTINVPETTVNVPPAQITVEPTPVTFPDVMKVEGMRELIDAVTQEPEPVKLLEGINNKNPIPVQMVDSKGRPFTAADFGGDGGPSTVAIRVGTQAVGSDNLLPVTTDGFSIPVFDQQVIDESAAPATTIITYKRAGATVATKTITVSGTTTTITVSIV